MARITTVDPQTILRNEAEAMRVYDDVDEIAFDIETTGLSHVRDTIAVIAFHAPGLPPAVLHYPDGVPYESAIIWWLNKRILVGHNLTSFDIPFLIAAGYDPLHGPGFFDTLIAEQMSLSKDRGKVSVALASTLKRHLNLTIDKNIDHSGWRRPVLTDDQLRYAANDIVHVLRLKEKQLEKIHEVGTYDGLITELESNPVTASFTAYGMPLSETRRHDMVDHAMHEAADMTADLEAMFWAGFNPRSAPQVKKAFDEILNFPLRKTDEDTMTMAMGEGGAVGQAAKLIVDARHLLKRGMYDEEWRDNYVTNGRVHAKYWSLGTDTGRYCVAHSTLVEAPRDLSKYPNGIPITEIVPGQLVYTFTEDHELTLRPVKWVGKTGTKPTVVIRAWNARHNHLVKLTLTADHQVRTIDGQWVEASHLNSGDRVLCMPHRRIDTYSELSGEPEHRIVARLLDYDTSPGVVIHHQDENTLNNSPDNLESKTIADHMRDHLTIPIEAIDKYVRTGETGGYGEKRLNRYAVDLGLLQPRRGWNTMSNEEFVARLNTPIPFQAVPNGRPKGFSTIRRRMYEMGMIAGDERLQGIDGRLQIVTSSKGPVSQHSLLTNHTVVSVESGPIVDVWDLEVEDTHLFIADGIAVHNSSSEPNMQQIPRDYRQMFEAPGDNVIISVDYSGIEVLVAGIMSREMGIVDAFREGRDVHTWVASQLFSMPEEKITKELRSIAKAASFTLLFGGGVPSMMRTAAQAGMPISRARAKDVIHGFFDTFPMVNARVQRAYELAGDPYPIPLKIPHGIRRVLVPPDKTAQRILNSIVQGTAAAGLKKGLKETRVEGIAHLVRTVVHDEIVFEVHKNDAEEVMHLAKRAMKNGMKEVIGMEPGVESKVGKNWS